VILTWPGQGVDSIYNINKINMYTKLIQRYIDKSQCVTVIYRMYGTKGEKDLVEGEREKKILKERKKKN
jgi:hypothetical protein